MITTEKGKTDKELFTDMLDRSGVVHSPITDSEAPDCSIVFIVAKSGPNNEGYTGFSTWFYFTPDGKLLKVAVWE